MPSRIPQLNWHSKLLAILVCTAFFVWLQCTPIPASEPANQPAASADAAKSPPLIDPVFLLIHDDGVRQDLKLTDAQQKSIDSLLQQHNQLLLAIRDVGPQGAPPEVAPKIGEIRQSLNNLLDETQQSRLEGLILQAQGYDALLRADMIASLKLLPPQQQKLRKIGKEFQSAVGQLNEASAGQSADSRQQALAKAQADRHQAVLGVINEQQKQSWAQRLGQPFDFAKLKKSPARAPEFTKVESWINSAPLSLESLRGRVVVVHFFAFGCINCIHNYPWYREWQSELPKDRVTIIGIHTPETQAETNVDTLREKLRENDLQFPVAVDNEKQNWNAWSNNMWPSVYLIDKKGRVRYWWYGELDWQGAGGQKLTRQRIDELLAESP
jgi:peroxiredoxin